MNSKANGSNLLVITHDQEDFDTITQILTHYFPNPDSQSTLLISNKYYRAFVNLIFKSWNEALNYNLLVQRTSQQKSFSPETSQKNEEQTGENEMENVQTKESSIKYDLMIMLVNQKQQSMINFELLDEIIENYNPEEFVLLIDTKNPFDGWVYEQTILDKCNNFIEIVKEDLWIIKKTVPNWARGALLNDEQENNECGIFSILDRIQTTRWTSMIHVKNEECHQKTNQSSKLNPSNQKYAQAQSIMKKNQSEKQSSNTDQKPLIYQQNLKSQQLQNKHEESSDQEETNDKKLEQEMRQFEDMMSQMIFLKTQSSGMKNEERKQKAEQLFANMLKGMTNFE